MSFLILMPKSRGNRLVNGKPQLATAPRGQYQRNKFNKIYITASPKRHFLCEKCKPRLEIGNLPPPIFGNWQCQKRKPPPREMLRIRLAACVRPRWGRSYCSPPILGFLPFGQSPEVMFVS